MKMHDLAEKNNMVVPAPIKKGKKPEPYYPSIHVDDVKDLAKHPVGKRLNLHIEAEVQSHEERQNRNGKKLTTGLKLRRLGIGSATRSGSMDGSMICPDCGKVGKGPMCPTCGVQMMARKKKAGPPNRNPKHESKESAATERQEQRTGKEAY